MFFSMTSVVSVEGGDDPRWSGFVYWGMIIPQHLIIIRHAYNACIYIHRYIHIFIFSVYTCLLLLGMSRKEFPNALLVFARRS